MNKTVRVRLSQESEEVFRKLEERASNSKRERSLLNAIRKKAELIKFNVHYGNPISKDRIPAEFVEKYGIKNLFRVELPQFWRLLYTLTEGETDSEVIAFVLDISPHGEYDKLFGYRKK